MEAHGVTLAAGCFHTYSRWLTCHYPGEDNCWEFRWTSAGDPSTYQRTRFMVEWRTVGRERGTVSLLGPWRLVASDLTTMIQVQIQQFKIRINCWIWYKSGKRPLGRRRQRRAVLPATGGTCCCCALLAAAYCSRCLSLSPSVFIGHARLPVLSLPTSQNRAVRSYLVT